MLLLFVGPTAPALANVATPVQAPGVAGGVATDQDDWDEILFWYLRWLYEHMGGSPSDVNPASAPVQCMRYVEAYYRKHGIRTDISAAEREAFRGVIVATQLHLHAAPLSVDPTALAEFNAILSSMLEDVEGETDTPH